MYVEVWLEKSLINGRAVAGLPFFFFAPKIARDEERESNGGGVAFAAQRAKKTHTCDQRAEYVYIYRCVYGLEATHRPLRQGP